MAAKANPPGQRIDAYLAWEIQAFFRLLCQGYQNGRLSFKNFSDALKDLKLYDREGNLWTIGARTGEWYHRDGNFWKRDEPAGALFAANQVLSMIKGNPVCPDCGARIQGDARFCPGCGKSLAPVSRSQRTVRRQVYCRKCGQPLNVSSRFCNRCGAVRSQ